MQAGRMCCYYLSCKHYNAQYILKYTNILTPTKFISHIETFISYLYINS